MINRDTFQAIMQNNQNEMNEFYDIYHMDSDTDFYWSDDNISDEYMTIPQLYSDSDSEYSSSELSNSVNIQLDKLFTDDDNSDMEIIDISDDSENTTDTNPSDENKDARFEEARLVMEMWGIHPENIEDYSDPVQYVDNVLVFPSTSTDMTQTDKYLGPIVHEDL